MNKTNRKLAKARSLLSLTRKVVSWLLASFELPGSGSLQVYLPLLEKMEVVLSSRGVSGLIDYVKKVRTQLLIYLSEDKDKSVEGISLDKRGLPRVLGRMKRHCGNDGTLKHTVLQVIFTILYSTRALKSNKKPDISTITTPSKARSLSIGRYTCDFWRELDVRSHHLGKIPKRLWWKEYHISTKQGPNGHALNTSILDLLNLPDGLVHSIIRIGGRRLTYIIGTLLSRPDLLRAMFHANGLNTRRIASFPDKEEKTRVIAIGDYWSQTSLRPLHNYVFDVMKRIPQDCTFHQSSFKEKIKDWKYFYSIDLTAFTDRFPIYIQELVLKGRFPSDYVDAWSYVMVGEPFQYGRTKVRYSVGNPMGFYSSWNCCTLAHHYVMYYCCRKLNKPWKTSKYIMLGDDILIGDHDLAKMYKEVILGLGVEFSALKTHESEHISEFAKRLVYKGVEITPFPISAIKEVSTRYYYFVDFLRETVEKGYVPSGGIPDAIGSFYRKVKRMRAKYCKQLSQRSVDCNAISSLLRGTITADEAVQAIARNNGYPDDTSHKIKGMFIIPNFIGDIFITVNKFNDKVNKKPIGIFRSVLDLFVNTYFKKDPDIDRFNKIIKLTPFVGCLNQLERKEEDIRLKALSSYWKEGSIEGWSKAIKDLTVPITDEIFSERSSQTVARATAILSDKIRSKLKEQYDLDQSGTELSYAEMLQSLGFGSSFTAMLTK